MNKSAESRISYTGEIGGWYHLNSVSGTIRNRIGRFLGAVREGWSDRLREIKEIARRITPAEAPCDGGRSGIPREFERTRNSAYLDIHRSVR
jgi:hypothetical protein